MKQFYENFSPDSDCFKLWIELHGDEKHNQNVSLLATQLTKNHVLSSALITIQEKGRIN